MKDGNKSLRQRVWKSFFNYFFYGIFGSYFHEANRYPEKFSNHKNWLERVYIELKHLTEIEKVPSHWIDSFYRTITEGDVKLPLHEGVGLFINEQQILFGDDIKSIKKTDTINFRVTSTISKTEMKRFIDDNWETIQKLQTDLNLPESTYPKTDFHSENFISYLLNEHADIPMKQILSEMQESADKLTGHTVVRNTLDKAFKKYKMLEKDTDSS